MKKFEFQNNEVEFEMLGYMLKADAAEAEIELSAAQKDLAEFFDKITAGNADKQEIKTHIEFALTKIDAAFGEGTAKALFANRTVSLHDALDVVAYSLAALKEFENNKTDLYKSFRGNREERRTGLNPVR